MASKRDFKKYVDQLGSVVVDEMVSAYYNVKEVDRDKVSQAIEKVLGAIGRAKCNSNVFFDRGEKAFESKEAYSKAKKAFFVALFDKIITPRLKPKHNRPWPTSGGNYCIRQDGESISRLPILINA